MKTGGTRGIYGLLRVGFVVALGMGVAAPFVGVWIWRNTRSPSVSQASPVLARHAPGEIGATSLHPITDAVESTGAGEEPAPPPTPQEPSGARPTADPAASLEELFADPRRRDEAYRARLEADRTAHLQEPYDGAWARGMVTQIEHATSTLVVDDQLQATISDLSCRQRTCLLRLSWPNYDIARAEYVTIASGLRAPCGRSLLLPRPEDSAAPYEATAVLRCRPSP